MGCVSSKLFKEELKRDIVVNNGGDCVNHVVSLTSSTYGALKLDNEQQPIKEIVTEANRLKRSPPREEPEVINAWELMEDLEDQVPVSNQPKRSPKSRIFLRGFADIESPLKFLNQIGSPKKVRRLGGKENKGQIDVFGRSDFSPKEVLKVNNSSENSVKKVLRLSLPVKGTPVVSKADCFGTDYGVSPRSKRRVRFSPLFDPELVALYEKELSEEEEQIKRIISPKPGVYKPKSSSISILKSYEKICPPGGEISVVIYTTTLRGIRKTFDDCNNVRSIIESHHIQMYERDISMDSGFKEELKSLMGSKEVKVPLVFVKGRLIGGADEVVKLEEEGKLGILFEGIAKANGGCEGCAGVRFVMCWDCNGSCKILDEQQKKMVRCGECNENGLIQCPICC